MSRLETFSKDGEPTDPSFPLVLSSQERELGTSLSDWRIFSKYSAP